MSNFSFTHKRGCSSWDSQNSFPCQNLLKAEIAETARGSAAKPVVRPRKPKKMGFDPKRLDDTDVYKTSGTNIFSESKSEMAGTAPGNAVKPVVKPRKPKSGF